MIRDNLLILENRSAFLSILTGTAFPRMKATACAPEKGKTFYLNEHLRLGKRVVGKHLRVAQRRQFLASISILAAEVRT